MAAICLPLASFQMCQNYAPLLGSSEIKNDIDAMDFHIALNILVKALLIALISV
jgi:hypothetical protein